MNLLVCLVDAVVGRIQELFCFCFVYLAVSSFTGNTKNRKSFQPRMRYHLNTEHVLNTELNLAAGSSRMECKLCESVIINPECVSGVFFSASGGGSWSRDYCSLRLRLNCVVFFACRRIYTGWGWRPGSRIVIAARGSEPLPVPRFERLGPTGVCQPTCAKKHECS